MPGRFCLAALTAVLIVAWAPEPNGVGSPGRAGLLGAPPASEGQPPTKPDPPQAQQKPPQSQQKPPDPAGGQPPPAGQAAPQGQQPVFRAGVNFVRVDVIVSDSKGTAVADLKQADFEVLEDGKPQTIETFRFIKLTGTPPPGAEAPRPIRSDSDEEFEAARDDVRLFAVFFDDYHVRRSSSMAVRTPLINFVTKQLGPVDMVALMYPLTPVGDLRFSRNTRAIVSAIEKFEGRKYDYQPRNWVEERYAYYPAEIVERIRNQVTLSAVEALVMHLGGVREGRKAVILVSEGWTNTLPRQLRDPIAAMPGLGNPMRGQPASGERSMAEERRDFFESVDLNRELRDVFDAANRNNTAIYTLDPRGLTPFEYDINEGVESSTDRRMLDSTLDTLRVLAENTDGRAIVNRNDLEAGLRQVVSDSSAYYLLGYNSSAAPSDGKFHEIRVRVKRPRVQVRARKGYWAPTVEDVKKATTPRPEPPSAVTKAFASIAEPRAGRFVRTWIGTSRGEQGRTRVTFVWEPMPPAPGVDRAAAAGVSLVAAGSAPRPYFRGRLPERIVSGDAKVEDASLPPYRVTFDAPPGLIQLKLGIEDRDGRVIDSDAREMTVPDLTAPQVALSTPAVLRAANAREFKQIAADPAAMPVAAREFRRTERLLVRFEAYAPGEVAPEVTARLLNRQGGAMVDVPVRPPAAPGAPFEIDLPLAGLAPGEYVLEVKARGQGGEGGEATELVPLRISS